MASTYSSNYKLEKMATGANANTWGTNTNNNLDVLDAFGAGYIAKSVAGSANITLTTGNADPSAEAANKVVELTGALTGSITVFVPAVEGEYVFFNNTTGSHTLTIAATGHAANGIAIAQGAYSHVYNDGTANYKMYNAVDKLGATTFKGDVTAGDSGEIILRGNGAVTATTFLGSGANLTGVDPFPSGTKQVFYQASAPTGWSKDTTAALNEAVMSVVTGSGGGTGGSTAYFSSFLATTNKSAPGQPVSGSVSGTVGAHTLSTPELASHTHPVTAANPQTFGSFDNPATQATATPSNTGSAGGGGSHTHPFTGSLTSATADVTIPAANVKYANVIIAAKD
mgnify:FL=1|jgi:hypothetical protein|tara:strand:- start:2059 stop:3081 length:1023 start_codon:yes stop_codon:yes gene_type:complete